MRPVTYKTVDNVRKILNYNWRNKAQEICIREILDHDQVIFQAYRQFFKSFSSKLIGASYVFNGGIPIVAAPTLTQSARIIYRGIKANTNQLLKATDIQGRREPDTTTETVWWEGKPYTSDIIGSLLALSANELSPKKPEGYTGDILLVDEGHDVNESMVGVFTPMLSDSRQAGTARVLITGVGGHKTSAIEMLKQRGYHIVRMPASRALELDPTLGPLFDIYREELSEWEWDKYYECKEITEGLRHMFPVVPGGIDITHLQALNMKPRYWFGIDVGKRIDATVVKVMEQYGEIVNDIESLELHGTDYVLQAQLIYNYINDRFIWAPNRISIETNGPGEVLRDILNQQQYFGLGGSIQGVTTTADLKEETWNTISRWFRNGTFGVSDPEARAHYEKLMYNVNDAGKIEFEHSDPYMALVTCINGMNQTIAL